MTPDDARAIARRVDRADLAVTCAAHDLATIERWRDRVDALVVSPSARCRARARRSAWRLRDAARAAGETTVVALGGIVDAASARAALDAGAWAIAARRVACDDGDVVASARALLGALDPAPRG
ncbi:MAG: hypothetical protein R3A52_04495 [Polyangiales bacterium]